MIILHFFKQHLQSFHLEFMRLLLTHLPIVFFPALSNNLTELLQKLFQCFNVGSSRFSLDFFIHIHNMEFINHIGYLHFIIGLFPSVRGNIAMFQY